MSIYELADMFKVQIAVKYRPNWDDAAMQWYASIENLEVTGGGVLTSSHGNGETPAAAIAEYATRIAGADVVINAYSDDLRTTFRVPRILTV